MGGDLRHDGERRELGSAPVGAPKARELVGLIASGDKHAFAQLARRYSVGMHSAAARFVDSHDVEDVVQQALIEAHRAIGRGTRPDDLGAWLRGITRNLARDALRARLREPLPTAPGAALSAHEVVEQREALGEIVEGVDELPDLQRRALLDSTLRGKSHEEIANDLGTTAGSVRMAIARAREALRRRLAVFAPLPLMELVRNAMGRVRDSSFGGVAAGVATLTVVAAVSAATVIERSPDGKRDASPQVSAAPAAAPSPGLSAPSTPSNASADRSRSDRRAAKRSRSSREPNPAPERAGAPTEPAPAPPNEPAPPPEQPPPVETPPAPGAPNPPPVGPIPSPEPPIPSPPPSVSNCGGLSQLVPCVLETVDELLRP